MITRVDQFNDEQSRILINLAQQYHFALTHHVDITKVGKAIRVHNYPGRWADH